MRQNDHVPRRYVGILAGNVSQQQETDFLWYSPILANIVPSFKPFPDAFSEFTLTGNGVPDLKAYQYESRSRRNISRHLDNQQNYNLLPPSSDLPSFDLSSSIFKSHQLEPSMTRAKAKKKQERIVCFPSSPSSLSQIDKARSLAAVLLRLQPRSKQHHSLAFCTVRLAFHIALL